MRRAKKGGGMTAEQVILAAVLVLAAMIAMTIHAVGEWSGLSAGEQLHYALFEAADWD